MKTTHSPERVREVFATFRRDLPVLGFKQNLSGHINQTYFVKAGDEAAPERFVLQCVNRHVFRNVEGLMDNVIRISAHLRAKSPSNPNPADRGRDFLDFLKTESGANGTDAPDGFWRMYRFVPDSLCRECATTAAEARSAAEAFGRFQAKLADLPGPRLVETIPHFHDTRRRFETLEEAFRKDVAGLASDPEVRDLLEGFRALRPLALSVQESFERGEMPERITHNDAKYSNVLVDATDGHALCVIDLDTCMPGLALHDFGDLVRSLCAEAAEDEPDVSKIRARPEMFQALADGFLAEAGGVLAPAERAMLANGGLAITTEVGVRFLTDALEGDHYFRTAYPRHNVVRARSQLALARSIAENLPVVRP